MSEKPNDIIKHHGVKGMRWGVRRTPEQLGHKTVDDKPTIKDHLGSLKRERQWKKIIKKVDDLSTEEIQTVSKRIKAENDLKELSRNKKITTTKDKRAYTFRANLSDEELKTRVDRLRAKETLHKRVDSASKEQREIGEKVVGATKDIAMLYVQNKKPTAQDIFEAATKKRDNNIRDSIEKEVKDRAVNELVKVLSNRSK